MSFRLRLSILATPLLALILAGTAHGHGEYGEHVEQFEDHLDTYAADVQAMSATVDAIAEGDKNMDALIEQWEAVKFHGAVEEVTAPLYPPVWAGISQLRNALDEQAEPAVVRERAEALKAALNQGLGALKWAAASGGQAADDHHEDEHGHDESQPATGPDAVDTIIEELEQAVALYQNDEVEQAQALIRKAYLQRFEYLEGDLIEQDAKLVAALEEDFNGHLPTLMTDGADMAAINGRLDTMRERLNRAKQMLADSAEDKPDVF